MDSITVRVVEGWLPLPEAVVSQLGWHEGTPISLEVVDGAILVTRAEGTPGPPARKPRSAARN